MSVLLIGAFLAVMYLTFRVEQTEESDPIAHDEAHPYSSETLSRALSTYVLAAAVVVGSAIWLAQTGDRLADEMGWEASYVGTQFLAFSTSLPELAVSVAAIRLNAPEMAITNVLGSNVFNMGFVLFLDDVAYTDGALWAAISDIHALTGLIAVLMTAVVVVGLVNRPRGRPGKFWTFESVILIGLYAAASLLVFGLS
jgi:cation:H+ antiporter